MKLHLTAIGLRGVTCHMGITVTQCCHATWHNTGEKTTRRDGRLSWPRWLVTYRDGLHVHKQSPIQVLTTRQSTVGRVVNSWSVGLFLNRTGFVVPENSGRGQLRLFVNSKYTYSLPIYRVYNYFLRERENVRYFSRSAIEHHTECRWVSRLLKT